MKFCFKIPVFVAVARPVRFRYKTSVISLYWLVMLLIKLLFLIQITIFYQYVSLLLLFLSILSLHNIMALRVVEYKIRKVFVYESTYSKEIIEFWELRIGLMGRCQIVPKFDFQRQFSTSKIIWIFLNFFFSLKNINLGTHFL